MAADRDANFITGPETSTLPTATVPTLDTDFIPLSFFNTTTDISSANVVVNAGTTKFHPFLTIDTGFTYTVSGQLLSAGELTVDGTLTVESGGTVLVL